MVYGISDDELFFLGIIVFGIGASLMYCTIMSVAPLWFNKRRGLALGVVASGSGIGMYDRRNTKKKKGHVKRC